MRRRRVRGREIDEVMKKTAFVNDPDTLWTLSDCGAMSRFDHEGTRKRVSISNNWWENAEEANCLSKECISCVYD